MDRVIIRCRLAEMAISRFKTLTVNGRWLIQKIVPPVSKHGSKDDPSCVVDGARAYQLSQVNSNAENNSKGHP